MITVHSRKDEGIMAFINEKKYHHVKFIRNFPLKSPMHAISVVDKDDQEIYWINDLIELDKESIDVILGYFGELDGIIEILNIEQISSNVFPCEWTVITKKKRIHFIVERSEHIIQMNHQIVLLKSAQSTYYIIRNIHSLNRESKKIIDPLILID